MNILEMTHAASLPVADVRFLPTVFFTSVVHRDWREQYNLRVSVENCLTEQI